MITKDKESIIQARKAAAELLIGVLNQQIDFKEAVKAFPQNDEDETLKCAFHILLYYDADDEYRAANPDYASEQNEYIEYISDLLSRGDDIPANIILEYKKYYETAPTIYKKGIMHIIKSLFRFIS